MCEYGYLNHTSTKERDDEAVASIFAALPCESVCIEQLWSEGEKRRPAFEALINKLKTGDVLYVHSIDRLGASAAEVARVWKLITATKRADIVVLNNPRLDTRSNRRLTPSQVKTAARLAFEDISRARAAISKPYAAFELVEAKSVKG